VEARRIDANRELLDHQLLDRNGRFCGNVDDVELEVPPGGGLPVVTALLSGPGILAERIGGRIGRGWAGVQRRLNPGSDDVGRIPMTSVVDIGSSIRLNADRRELDADQYEGWFREHVVERIPGAGRAPD
jgi:sporulation protein YlmC with PRC-barrel domain